MRHKLKTCAESYGITPIATGALERPPPSRLGSRPPRANWNASSWLHGQQDHPASSTSRRSCAICRSGLRGRSISSRKRSRQATCIAPVLRSGPTRAPWRLKRMRGKSGFTATRAPWQRPCYALPEAMQVCVVAGARFGTYLQGYLGAHALGAHARLHTRRGLAASLKSRRILQLCIYASARSARCSDQVYLVSPDTLCA